MKIGRLSTHRFPLYQLILVCKSTRKCLRSHWLRNLQLLGKYFWKLILIQNEISKVPYCLPFYQQILVTVPQCLEILFISPCRQHWTRNVKYVIFDEVKEHHILLLSRQQRTFVEHACSFAELVCSMFN